MFEDAELELTKPRGDWAQADFFTPLPPPPPALMPLAPGAITRDYGSRWYQDECHEAVLKSLEEHMSTLVVMATGLGKSFCFSRLAAEWDGPVLVIAHRDELVRQAAKHLEYMTGEQVDIEKAEEVSDKRTRIVVGSVQSMNPGRLARLGKNRFSLVIIDEAHHATSMTYQRLISFFEAKTVGFTATPNRADEAALGQVFEDDAFLFDIQQGIEAGYLVPLVADVVEGIEVDLTGIGTDKDGDFIAAQLDKEMVKHVEGIVKETLRLHPDRRGPVFFPGVKSAELACQRFNALSPGSACFVSGETDPDERRELNRRYKAGEFRYYCNCAIATEGWDDPTADIVVLGRPSKSTALVAQQIGRGTRVLPGVADAIPGKDGAAKRRAAIAASAKPNCLILDVVSTSIGDALVTPVDVLGGNFEKEAVALAKKKTKKGGDVLRSLEAARDELRRIAEKAESRVKSQVRRVDPFAILGIAFDPAEAQRFGYRPPTEGQVALLKKRGLGDADLEGLSRKAASKLLDEQSRRITLQLASFKQMRQLQRFGIQDQNISFTKANRAMDYIIYSKWKPDPVKLNEILYAIREPGED